MGTIVDTSKHLSAALCMEAAFLLLAFSDVSTSSSYPKPPFLEDSSSGDNDWAARMLEAGFPPHVVGNILGHFTPDTEHRFGTLLENRMSYSNRQPNHDLLHQDQTQDDSLTEPRYTPYDVMMGLNSRKRSAEAGMPRNVCIWKLCPPKPQRRPVRSTANKLGYSQ